MLTYAPDYYHDFHCSAGACRHTCCAGWEIDIDPDALTLYDALDGEIGRRLRAGIDREGGAHFRLGDGERCPMLNPDGLCSLILALGEGALCETCAEHPRFRNYFSDRVEVGLGLTCEAAARLILTRAKPMRLIPIDDDGIDAPQLTDELELIARRDGLLNLLADESISYEARRNAIAKRCGYAFGSAVQTADTLSDEAYTAPDVSEQTNAEPVHKPDTASQTAAAQPLSRARRDETAYAEAAAPQQWAQRYLELERLDERWTELLERLAEGDAPQDLLMAAQTIGDTPRAHLLSYFIYRHVSGAAEDGRFMARLRFALLSADMVCALAALRIHYKEADPLTLFIDTARMYSSEIEYSDINTDELINRVES